MSAPKPRAATLALAVAAGAALAGGSVAATAGTAPRRSEVDIRHVAIDLQFDLAARQAHGTTTLTLAPRRATRQVRLDAGRLAIERITLGSRTLRWNYDGGDADDGLQIQLDRAYAPHEVLQLQVAYRTTWHNAGDPNSLWGSNGRGLRFLGPSTTDPRRRVQVWAGGDPGGNRFWFPGFDAPGHLRTSELKATVPKPLQVVAGGRPLGVRDNADGTHTYHFRTERPEPNHRTTFAIGEFAAVNQQEDGIALASLGYPDERAGVQASAEQFGATLRFLQQLTGRRLPQRRYAQVFVQDLPWNTPGSGFSVLTENFVDDAGTHADFQYLWDGLQTESLAQQWFGGLVPVCDWPHLWLERAMAHHLAALFTEQRHGRDEYLLWYVQANQAATLADWAQGQRQPVVDPAPQDRVAWAGGNAPYMRGAAVLNTLRHEIGDAAWRRVIRHFVRTRAGKLTCTDALQRSVQAVTKRPMAWFFEQWVTGAGHPVFEVSKQWDAAAGQLVVRARQVQAGPTEGAPPRWFQGALEIEIDDQVQRVHVAAQAENEWRFALPAAPRHVHFDRGDAWIKELRFERSSEELLHQFLHTRDAAGRQAAMLTLVQRARAESAAPADRQRVAAALLDVALRPSPATYWRVRMNALQQLAQLLTPQRSGAAAVLDAPTEQGLLTIVREEAGWLRTAAVRVLALTRDARHAPLYQGLLADPSDRVVNAAAIGLGRSSSPEALAALLALPAKPSWKNQSLISALNGLKELGDGRGADLALRALADRHSPRWTLATPVWDYRLAAADTLAALGRAGEGTALVLSDFDQALAAGERIDIFTNVQLLVSLGERAAERIFPQLRERFAGDEEALKATQAFEEQLAAKLKAR